VEGAGGGPLAELPSGTVTFLFTDLVDSTRLWEEHPEAMPAALARHDDIVRTAIAAHDGELVKTTGDGFHAVFAHATDALGAAVDAQRELSAEPWGEQGELRVRMGLHSGAAEFRGGDYPGLTVNRAARVMSVANGGQVVVSSATAGLVGDHMRDGVGLVDLGEHRLRGLARSERVFQLVAPGLCSDFPPLQSADAFPGMVAFPYTPFVREDYELVGRDTELATLERAWSKATDGLQQIALIGGEAGIGKTRLVAEFTRRVHADGAVVLYGRCDEEVLAPYQPFVEALRPYVAAYSAATLRERLHGLEVDLARAFPELAGRVTEPPQRSPVESDRGTERYRLFEAFAVLLSGISAAGPAVLVLDDLHWADQPTLLLVRHLLRTARTSRVLIVICYRDVEVGRGHPLDDVLSDLRREQSVTRVVLRGLSGSASADFVRSLAAQDISPKLAEALHHETGGNPLFLEEVVRHVIETGGFSLPDGADIESLDALDLPKGVRDVIVRRIRRLPVGAHDVLDVAAVIGPEFDVDLIVRVLTRPAAEVLDVLDEAADAGLVTEHFRPLGRYSFSHNVIRQTLYTELKTAQRVRLHERVGTAIEERDDRKRSAAVLSHHFMQALPLIGASKATEYATIAGHNALTDLAFEDAASYFQHALELVEQHARTESAQHVELLIDYADALGFVDQRSGADAAMRAVRAARELGSPLQFGRAVTVLAEPNHAVVAFPTELPRLFEEAQKVLAGDYPALRARLLGQEAFKYISYMLTGRDGRALARAAVSLARETDDALTLADSLFALATSLEGLPDLDERRALGEELVALGAGMAARPWTFGLRILAGTSLEAGDRDALIATIDELERVGEQFSWLPARAAAAQWCVTVAILEGRFEVVERYREEMREYRRGYGGVAGMAAVQTYFLSRERGELDSVAPVGRMQAQAEFNLYARGMFALTQLEADNDRGAVANLDVLESDDFFARATEGAWIPVLAILSEVAATGGTPRQAQILTDCLEPYAGRLVSAHLGLACLGAADRYLGMLACIFQRWDDAEVRFEAALALEEKIGGAVLLPRTRYWQARFLRARGNGDDERVAGAILNDVIVETSRLGMPRLCAQAEALRRD
jgi:class 3 adenylate cyclase